MSVIVYGLKTCDTCRKALKLLEAKGIPATLTDIRAEADLETKLPVWLASVGPEVLLNTRSTTWRDLSEADKARADDGNLADLLKDHPTLIKRPVIEVGSRIFVGWSAETEASVLSA